MKRFIFSILCVSVFFIGLGGIASQVGARFKSDERALALIRQARIAIGGEVNINAVRSLTAKGRAAHTFNFDGADKTQEGDIEINFALPNQFSKMMNLQFEKTADGSKQTVNEEKHIVIVRKGGDGNAVFNSDDKDGAGKKKIVIVKNGNGEIQTEDVRPDGDGNRAVNERRIVEDAGARHNNDEFLRTMLGLFLTAPEGVEVEYFYGGAGDVDGNACEIVEARTGDHPVAKIYLSKSTNLPVMLSYQGMDFSQIAKIHHDDMKANADNKDAKVFVSDADVPTLAEINVKFSDYRTVGGVQLPFTWTQTANGKTAETVSIESYELNPANIADKFNQMPTKVMMRTQKQ